MCVCDSQFEIIDDVVGKRDRDKTPSQAIVFNVKYDELTPALLLVEPETGFVQ